MTITAPLTTTRSDTTKSAAAAQGDNTTTIEVAQIDTPVGRVQLAARASRLCGLTLGEFASRMEAGITLRFGAVQWRRVQDPAGAAAAIRAYMGGELDALQGLGVDPGGTPFQARVWEALRRVGAGHTVSYGELAALAGHALGGQTPGSINEPSVRPGKPPYQVRCVKRVTQKCNSATRIRSIGKKPSTKQMILPVRYRSLCRDRNIAANNPGNNTEETPSVTPSRLRQCAQPRQAPLHQPPRLIRYCHCQVRAVRTL